MSSNFSSIPILDLSLADNPTTKHLLLSQLRHAITEIGFLYIKNHGVPVPTTNAMTAILPELFALSPAAKEEVNLHHSPHFLGYSGLGAETTAKATDHREQFEFATEFLDTYDPRNDPLYTRLHGPNQWPSSLPHTRPIIERYISDLTALSTVFLALVAECLSLPPATFTPFLSRQHRLKIAHYPPSSPSGRTSQGVGPHKDSSGWWTFLLQASPSAAGLEALNKSGEWIPVPPVPNTLVVNIGQAFEVATNGLCRATTHRVLSGPTERYSIPFFQGVRGSLTKSELKALWGDFPGGEEAAEGIEMGGKESTEGRAIDSAFLRGVYDTWGESQLRTKVRSHRDVGEKFYGDVFEKYVSDDG